MTDQVNGIDAGKLAEGLLERSLLLASVRTVLQLLLIGLVLDPIEFIMERKMMQGIKERAEASARVAREENQA